ncbi:MAG: AAA family ATPase [Actinomycetota bacterium]|nr:MAG: AAA family ATPase [Actinomycetota bacterium]
MTTEFDADHADLADEQRYVADLYARLDGLRALTAQRLAAVRRSRAGGSPQNLSERDSFAALHEDRLAQLWSVEDRLCFGRLDLSDGSDRHIGRLGLSDDDQRQLLVDWRAPAARLFYQATAAAPGDVVRRRHLSTRGRTVTGLTDEVLDLDALPDAERSQLRGEPALLAALSAHRTGRMGDIVATIQAEQDRIIRADLPGVLVVQGGPGTGKTAVALHRAAYLLYTHRERLGRSGVLLVGPSPVFLRYIEQVLPSLGETGVVTTTAGGLYPGVVADIDDVPAVAALKGDLRMAEVLANAVRARQRVPEAPVPLDVEGHTILLRPAVVAGARDRARRSGKPHNLARVGFVRDLLNHLADLLARDAGVSSPDAGDHADFVETLRGSRDVRRAVNLAWMPLTPEQLLSDLYANPQRRQAAAPQLSAAECALLQRDPGSPWTRSDVPLLDEAAELLGEDDEAERAQARLRANERAADLAYARQVLGGSGGGMVSAETLVDRFADHGPVLDVAERAAADRSWAYGHVVVDEAQELSAMAWRLLARRCPMKSMTVVGDVAQTGSPAGSTSWAAALDASFAGRWRVEELTVNYRTPARIMAAAARVLADAGITTQPPSSVRDGEDDPVAVRVAAGDWAAVTGAVAAAARATGEGRIAVVLPRRGYAELRQAIIAGLPPGTAGSAAAALDRPVAVLGVEEVKGLEFDTVVLVEPADLLGQSEFGAHDLYVALTRPTQRLVLVHARELPPALRQL